MRALAPALWCARVQTRDLLTIGASGLPTLHCVVFAPPACVSQQLARDATEAVTAVVVGDDLVPRLSPASVETLRSQVLRVDWTQEVAVFSKLGVLPPLQQWVNKTMYARDAHACPRCCSRLMLRTGRRWRTGQAGCLCSGRKTWHTVRSRAACP